MSDMEKAIVLHDYIDINCAYDTGMTNANRYTAYGVLVNQIAVCQGYALTYKLLLNQVGIECLMVSSTKLNHAWNMVKLDGKYYQVDTTWDDPVNDRIGRARHFYMFVSDAAFLDENDRDHNADDWQIVKDGYIADVSATDTSYDDYFWKKVDAPFVIDDDSCYYISSSGQLVQGNLEGNVSKVLKSSIDTWNVWNSGGYWSGTYSGLYTLDDKLYYNKRNGIYRIDRDGTTEELTYSVDNTSGYMYGSALVYNCTENRYQINYVVATTPKFTGSEPIYEAVIDDTAYPEVIPTGPMFTVNGATLDIAEGILLDAGTSVTLTAEDDAQIYYTTDDSIPAYGGLLYTAPLTIDQDTTLKAITYKNGLSSAITKRSYVVANNELILSETEITMKEGETKQLSPTKLPSTKTAFDIIWSSSAESVASVTSNGKISALKEGETTITATVTDWQNRTVTAECQVTITAQNSDPDPDPDPIQEYTVTFVGFNGEIIKSETVQEGENATPPKAPEVPGYRFTGWNGNYTAVTKDETVTAQYVVITYTITYVLTEGTHGNTISTYTVVSEDIVLEDATGREGYIFVGWYDNEDYIGVPIRTISKGSTGDITLYGRWKIEKDLWMKWDDLPEGSSYTKEYTGSAIKPAFSVYYGETPLKAGTDYTVTYKNNTKVWQTNKDEKDLTSAEKSKAPSVIIKGKGNYTGTVTSIFQITPKNIESGDVEVYAVAAAYNNKVQKLVPKVIWGKTTLKNNRDFTVSYPDEGEENPGAYREAAKYRIIVEGTGNYCGQIESSITIVATNAKDETAPRLMSKAKVTAIPAQEYTGNPVNLEELGLPVIKYSGKQLTEGVDYRLVYGSDCKEIGTYPLTIVGVENGQYVGEIHTTFKIKGLSASTMKITGIVSQVYDGTAQRPKPTVTDKAGNPLKEGTDYEIGYEKNEDVGTAKIAITGKGKYSGTVKKNFKITALPLTDIPAENLDIQFVRGTADTQPYEKGGAKPKLLITYRYTDDGQEKRLQLTEGTDYKLSYKNNTSINPKAGKEPYILVTGKKNFKSSLRKDFKIVQTDISVAAMTAADVQENTKAGKYYSTPVLKDANGKKLVKGTDYEAAFCYTDQYGNELTKASKPTAGTVITVTVTGKGNYTGTNQTTYRIYKKGKNISSAKVTVLNPFYYTGEPIYLSKSDLVIKLNGVPLNSEDYEIDLSSYVNNTKKGTAKVTIKGKGDYAGTKTISFKIKAQSMKWWEKLIN